MSRDTLYKEISNLERKINLLLAEHTRLKEQLEYKEQENDTLRSKIENQETRLTGFQNKQNISKIVSNTVVGKEDAAELKRVLDEYIKEIDKCIIHLGEA